MQGTRSLLSQSAPVSAAATTGRSSRAVAAGSRPKTDRREGVQAVPPQKVVLLTGALGFLGSRLIHRLVEAGYSVRCGTPDPERAARIRPNLHWVALDVHRKVTVEPALRGVNALIHLLHAGTGGYGPDARESAVAHTFADAAVRAGLDRIVYLGAAPPKLASLEPTTRPSMGQILRDGAVPVFELNVPLIIGRDSPAWQIVRDLAARLRVMVLPQWCAARLQPIAVEDVVDATTAALALPIDAAGLHDLPGPETLTFEEILLRLAALRGRRPVALSVPILSPRLSSYWLNLVTGAEVHAARQLVLGLLSDRVAPGRGLWGALPDHHLVPFDDAARRAMGDESGALTPSRPQLERAVDAT